MFIVKSNKIMFIVENNKIMFIAKKQQNKLKLKKALKPYLF